MKTKNILAAFTLLAASLCPTMAQAQSDEAKMNTFIDNLMNKMTLKEKLGQLNLPVTGDIVTGQAKSSDVASKIKRGEVGGLFNLKGVEKIKEVQKIAVEQSRLHTIQRKKPLKGMDAQLANTSYESLLDGPMQSDAFLSHQTFPTVVLFSSSHR